MKKILSRRKFHQLYQPKETHEFIFSKSLWFILKTDLVECRSTMYVWEVTRLGLCNGQGKLLTENAYLKK